MRAFTCSLLLLYSTLHILFLIYYCIGPIHRTYQDWAANCGVQQSEGVQLTSYDGVDYFPMTQSDIPAGSPVMFVPSDLIITSTKIAQEFPSLQQCENQLTSAGLDDKVPLFRIFYKIIAEYEKGDQSQWVSLLQEYIHDINDVLS